MAAVWLGILVVAAGAWCLFCVLVAFTLGMWRSIDRRRHPWR